MTWEPFQDMGAMHHSRNRHWRHRQRSVKNTTRIEPGLRPGAVASHLKGVVEGEPVEENVGEELAQAEDSVHHPVRQPFGVILFARTLNGFDPEQETETQLAAASTSSQRQTLTSNKPGRRSR